MKLEFHTKNFSLSFGSKSKNLLRDEAGNITGYDVGSVYDIATPYVASSNFITLFETLPEVSFPVRFIIDKILKGNFMLKSQKDDSVIWNNEEMNQFLTRPNPLQTFSEFVTSHFAYKFVTGNSFIKAAVPSSLRGKELWKWCDNYWVLPSDCVEVRARRQAPLFSVAGRDDLIECYQLTFGGVVDMIDPGNILHVKEMNIDSSGNYMEGKSRLVSQLKPISNLIPVYEARNIIYTKRGALGIIVSRKKDDSGSVPLKPNEKEEIRREYNDAYGVGDSRKSPVAIMKDDVGFIKTSMSIQELQPFDETLVDAINIAGAYSIPSMLVPRKEASTYDNQASSERGVYSNIVIPEAKAFVRDMTQFLGLDRSGMYLDVDYSDVDVLQAGNKERQETMEITSRKCRDEFLGGVITLNDWRAQIGESAIDSPIYNKLVLEMDNDEIGRLRDLGLIGNSKNYKNGTI